MATLRREIGLLDATMIVVSGVIGGGIFFTPSTVAGYLPQAGWIIAVWVAGAFIAFAGALTFAELASRYPEAGGHYVYIREAFGGLWAFLYGWMLLLIIATGALASLALAFAGYLSAFVPLSPVQQKLVAVAIIAGLSALNLFGVKPGAKTTTILTVIKVGAFVSLIVLGLASANTGVPQEVVLREIPTGSAVAIAFGAALVPVLFSYGGWQQVNFLAGEVKSAERRLPIALALGVAVVAVVYLGANFVYLRALGPFGMADSSALASDTARALYGQAAARVVTVVIAISILAFSNVVVMATPRVFYALAQDGAFLKSLTELHPRYHTPAKAILLQGVWTIVLIVIGEIGLLVNGVVFADWIFFGLGAASIFAIRRRAAGPAPYEVPGYPIVPAFFVLAAIAAVASAISQYPKESLVGVAMLAGGSVLYFMTRSGRGE
ncbi:MAG: amino acid permease [Gemmatimonadota bacterium]